MVQVHGIGATIRCWQLCLSYFQLVTTTRTSFISIYFATILIMITSHMSCKQMPAWRSIMVLKLFTVIRGGTLDRLPCAEYSITMQKLDMLVPLPHTSTWVGVKYTKFYLCTVVCCACSATVCKNTCGHARTSYWCTQIMLCSFLGPQLVPP